MSVRLHIGGRDLHTHPLQPNTVAVDWEPVLYVKTTPVLAYEAPFDGDVDTPEGEMAFSAGDMIVTDYPPTHAWPVARDVFARTYEAKR